MDELQRLVPQEEKDSIDSIIFEEDTVLYSHETVTFLSSRNDVSRRKMKIITGKVTRTMIRLLHHKMLRVIAHMTRVLSIKTSMWQKERTPKATRLHCCPLRQGSLLHQTHCGVQGFCSVPEWNVEDHHIILQFLWFGSSWLYFGIILLTTSLLQYDPHCSSGMDDSNSTNSSCEDTQLDTGDYVKILWAAAAELPGLLITLVIIDHRAKDNHGSRVCGLHA